MSEKGTKTTVAAPKRWTQYLITIRGRWSYCALLFLIASCWTALRFEYTPQFEPASYERIFDFTAAVPFGKRVLTPLLAHIGTWMGLGIIHAFEIIEIVSVVALFLGLERVFRVYVDCKSAKIMGAVFFVVLPWLFFVPIRWTLLFPWDLPAMALTTWGTWAVLSGRWKTLCGLMILASLNRESAILLPMLWGAIWAEHRQCRQTLGIAALLCIIHASCQTAIWMTLADNMDYYQQLRLGMSMQVNETWRLLRNWHWLSEYGQRPIVWLGTMAGLPLAFLCGARRCGVELRRLGLVAWFYFWMLIVVGNIYEARVFGEISVLLYIPVALYLWKSMTGKEVSHPMGIGNVDAQTTWLKWLEWVCCIGIASAVVLLGWGFAHGLCK